MLTNSIFSPIILGCLLLFAFAILFSCKTTNKIPEDYDKRMVHFGGGGGFSGQYYEFCLLENGSMFNIDTNNKDHTYAMRLKKKQTKEIFNKIDHLSSLGLDYNEPGNMYKFIKIQEGQNEGKNLVWGNPSLEVDSNLDSLYATLISLTQNSEINNNEK